MFDYYIEYGNKEDEIAIIQRDKQNNKKEVLVDNDFLKSNDFQYKFIDTESELFIKNDLYIELLNNKEKEDEKFVLLSEVLELEYHYKNDNFFVICEFENDGKIQPNKYIAENDERTTIPIQPILKKAFELLSNK